MSTFDAPQGPGTLHRASRTRNGPVTPPRQTSGQGAPTRGSAALETAHSTARTAGSNWDGAGAQRRGSQAKNDTKRHRIALAALLVFLSTSHRMPASKSGGVPSERAPVVWTVGHRASSSCMRVEQHTRENCTAPPTRPKIARLRWFIRPIPSRFSNFSFSPFSPGGIETSSPRGVD